MLLFSLASVIYFVKLTMYLIINGETVKTTVDIVIK